MYDDNDPKENIKTDSTYPKLYVAAGSYEVWGGGSSGGHGTAHAV